MNAIFQNNHISKLTNTDTDPEIVIIIVDVSESSLLIIDAHAWQ